MNMSDEARLAIEAWCTKSGRGHDHSFIMEHDGWVLMHWPGDDYYVIPFDFPRSQTNDWFVSHSYSTDGYMQHVPRHVRGTFTAAIQLIS